MAPPPVRCMIGSAPRVTRMLSRSTSSASTTATATGSLSIQKLASRATYTYDENGNLLTSTDALGNAVSYVYDRLNRAMSATQADPDGDVMSGVAPNELTASEDRDWLAGTPPTSKRDSST